MSRGALPQPGSSRSNGVLIHERQNQILDILSDRQAVTVAELAALLKVSTVTIRT
ncbi:DeoR family transcriptional regulator, partial [Enterococcus casseliflavus]|uniref:DeoR family transcriptional regulator n=1 Tax=Enterococcus casseliflavus TaxID=37734 RepID=UPI003D11C953